MARRGASTVSGIRKASISGRSPNFVDPITIGFDKLQIIIEGFRKRFVDRMLWLAPGGVVVTLATTLIVSDFKKKFGLEANDWRDLTFGAFVVFTIWSIICFFRAENWQSTESSMDDIGQASLAPTRNYALTFFKARGRDGSNLLLVYFDVIWNCYLCPFVGQQPGNSDPDNVREPAADRFNLPKHALFAEEIDVKEVRTQKRSESSHHMTPYRFTFYRMKVAADYEDMFRGRVHDSRTAL